jgi:methionine synthase I (cobalamin-dependent)
MAAARMARGVASKRASRWQRAAAETFAEQAAALREGGADLLILETFRHLDEIKIAIDAA